VTPQQPVVSGKRLIKTGRRNALVVPLHKEIKRGTLGGILRDADLTADDLRRLLG
jgi:hypothetical protein